MSNPRTGLAVLVRYPDPGKVLPLLGREIGNRKSAAVARKMTDAVLEAAKKSADRFSDIFFFIQPREKQNDAAAWIGNDFPCLPQIGASAIERLKNSFKFFFVKKCRRVIVVGTDVLGITDVTFDAAIKGFEGYDCLLGPKTRGGLYLVGMSQFRLEIFDTIEPGEKDLLRALRGAMAGHGMRVGMMEKKLSPTGASDLPPEMSPE